MDKEKNFKKIDKNFDYIYFSRAYLIIAYSGIENREKNTLAENEELIYEISHENNYIIAPILYNIKHAIELFIKAISKIFELNDKDFENKHDLKILFSKIKIKLNKNHNIQSSIEELEKLIIKYHQNKFIDKKLKNNFSMEDEKNDVFRYPDNKAKIDLNFEKIFSQFKEKDFSEEIKNDIQQFYKLFYDIGREILGINKELQEIEKNLKKQ
jgi:hypothetical protein